MVSKQREDIVEMDSLLQAYLLWNPACQRPQVTAGVTARKVITAADLEVGFLEKCRPQQSWLAPINDVE
jgi:hypothetical protein